MKSTYFIMILLLMGTAFAQTSTTTTTTVTTTTTSTTVFIQPPSANVFFTNETNTSIGITNFTREVIPNNATVFKYHVCVNQTEPIIQQFFFTQQGFSGNFSNSTLFNISGCVLTNLTVFVPNVTTVQSSSHKIVLLSTSNSYELPINLTVVSQLNWQITPQNVTKIVKKEEIGQGVYLIDNFGNIPVTLTVKTINNDENIIWTDEQSIITIPPGQFILRPFYYNIREIKPGERVINITFTDQIGFQRSIQFNLDLKDIYPPQIDDIDLFSGEKINPNVEQIVIVKVSDDKKVTSVTYTDFATSLVYNFSRINDITYQITYKETNQSGIKNFVITVYDEANNSVSESGSFEVVVSEKLQINSHSDFGKIRTYGNREIHLGEAGAAQTLVFSLQKMEKTVEAPLKVYINGVELRVFENISFNLIPSELLIKVEQFTIQTQDINGSIYTDYNLSKYNGDFFGEIGVITEPNIKNPFPKISFSGRYDTYSSCVGRSINIPFLHNGILITRNMTCTPIDVGEYSNSSCTCQVAYPVDVNTDILAPIMTVESLSAERDAYRLNLTVTKAQGDIAAFWGGLFGFTLIILSGIFFVAKFIWAEMHKH